MPKKEDGDKRINRPPLEDGISHENERPTKKRS